MAKRYKGDGDHQLPALQVEPYRLWFEFLKLAATDETVTIDRARYHDWGDFENLGFKDWWSANWRRLFAVAIGVREVGRAARAQRTSDNDLVLAIPLHQDRKVTLRQIEQILDQYNAGAKLVTMPKGQFHLTIGSADDGHEIHPSTRFLRNLDKVRLLLHVYRFWLTKAHLDDRRRIEETAKGYFQWADGWNNKVRLKGWNRPLIEIPAAVRDYVQFLELRGNRRRVALVDVNDSDAPNARRQIARYVRKARRIAANVARGEFPGEYDRNVQSDQFQLERK